MPFFYVNLIGPVVFFHYTIFTSLTSNSLSKRTYVCHLIDSALIQKKQIHPTTEVTGVLGFSNKKSQNTNLIVFLAF